MSGARTAGEVVLDAPPSLAPLYARALAGRLRRSAVRDLGATRAVVVAGAPVDPGAVARYARVCGYPLTDAVPVTYPHLLAFGAQVHLMAAQPFPFPLLGLVHTRQVIAQHRPLRAGERPGVRVWAERLAAHPRGATVDLRAVLEVGDEVVWEGRSTYLARGASAPDGAGPDPAAPGAGPDPAIAPSLPATAVWPVAAGTGRRYAAVSGDVNPIHLSALTARALGFPRAIAHGMWTTARTLAALTPRLPAAVTADVVFARPVLLPSSVALVVRPVRGASGSTDGGTDGVDVAVRSRSGERLHLVGAVRPGARAV